MRQFRVLGFILLCSVLPALAANWQTLRGTRYVQNDFNDGDSFHVQYNGKPFLFRLYFVDSPETDLKDSRLKDRIQEQADYFGITTEQVVKIGKRAAQVTDQALRSHSFTVTTRWLDARGSSKMERFYSLIEFDLAGKQQDLGEYLVSQGLARVHGVDTDIPGGRTSKAEVSKLIYLEREAKAGKKGAWALDGTNVVSTTVIAPFAFPPKPDQRTVR